MKRYIYLLSSDCKHMEHRLKQLATKGMELKSLERLFTGEFDKTQRKDLSYVAIPIQSASALPTHFDPTQYGYELVGGYNNMAIFKSLPCAELDRKGLEAQLAENNGIQKTLPLVVNHFLVQLLIAVCFFLLAAFVPFYQREWYLSYSGICIHAFRWVFAALFGINLVLLPTYAGAWIRSLTPWLISGSILTSILLGLLDLRQDQGMFFLLVVGVAAACVLGLWKLCKGIGFGIAACCAIVLAIGIVVPHVNVDKMSGTSLRPMVEHAPVVTLADFEWDAPLEGSGYITKGTFFAKQYSYTEFSAEASLNTETYRCIDNRIADLVEADLMEHGRWLEGELEQTWVSASGKTVLMREGKTVSVVSFSEDMETDQIARLQEVLFE